MGKILKGSLFVLGVSLAVIGGVAVFGGGLTVLGYGVYGCMCFGGIGIVASTGWDGVIAVKDYATKKKDELSSKASEKDSTKPIVQNGLPA